MCVLQASFLAVNEWSIFKALHIFMPSPLSGMLQEEEERVEVLVHRDGKGGQKRRYVYVCMYMKCTNKVLNKVCIICKHVCIYSILYYIYVLYICVCVYVCMYVWKCVCMYVCI